MFSHVFPFSYLHFISLGCRISGQFSNWTQAAPGTAGWNLFHAGRLPPSSGLYAADGQQRHPRDDCSAGYQQSQCWLGSHCRPNSLRWILQVGGASVTPLGWLTVFYFISKHASQNGTINDPDQTRSRWDFIDPPSGTQTGKAIFSWLLNKWKLKLSLLPTVQFEL